MVGVLRYRIISAGVKGMTFKDPPDREIHAFKNTVFFDRFIGIGGTGRVKPAGGTPFQWRYPFLIKTDQNKQYFFQRETFSFLIFSLLASRISDTSISVLFLSAAAPLATITISSP